MPRYHPGWPIRVNKDGYSEEYQPIGSPTVVEIPVAYNDVYPGAESHRPVSRNDGAPKDHKAQLDWLDHYFDNKPAIHKAVRLDPWRGSTGAPIEVRERERRWISEHLFTIPSIRTSRRSGPAVTMEAIDFDYRLRVWEGRHNRM